jgi:hypothetical protein
MAIAQSFTIWRNPSLLSAFFARQQQAPKEILKAAIANKCTARGGYFSYPQPLARSHLDKKIPPPLGGGTLQIAANWSV